METIQIILIYIIISFIGILLHDFKYLFFLNSTSKVKAVVICGIYVIFNTMTTKLIASQPIEVSIPVITLTNMLSMWIAMTYSERQLKEYIFNFEITTKYPKLRFELKDKFKKLNIPYEYQWYYYENDKENEEGIETNEFGETLYHKYIVHAFTKRHSKQLLELLKSYPYSQVKYNITNTSNYITR